MTTFDPIESEKPTTSQPLTKKQRILAAIGVFVAFVVGGALFYVGGLVIGIMAIASCHNLPNWTGYYLPIIWPAVMLVTSFIAPALILAKRRWYWVVAGLALALILSAATYILWFPLVMSVC